MSEERKYEYYCSAKIIIGVVAAGNHAYSGVLQFLVLYPSNSVRVRVTKRRPQHKPHAKTPEPPLFRLHAAVLLLLLLAKPIAMITHILAPHFG